MTSGQSAPPPSSAIDVRGNPRGAGLLFGMSPCRDPGMIIAESLCTGSNELNTCQENVKGKYFFVEPRNITDEE